MDVHLVIFTHSDYSYLWPIINDSMKFFTNIQKVFAYNDTNKCELPANFDTYITYNEKNNYTKRLLYIMSMLITKHMLLIHDVNIVINFEMDKFEKYYQLAQKHDIDRLALSVYDCTKPEHCFSVKDDQERDYIVCDLNHVTHTSRHYTPFDLNNHMWKIDSFKLLCMAFPDDSYNWLEKNPAVQNFCRTNYKCFGIRHSNVLTIQYSIGQVYSDIFKFLHITAGGRILTPHYCYLDTQTDFLNIINKYKLDINRIGTEPHPQVLQDFYPII